MVNGPGTKRDAQFMPKALCTFSFTGSLVSMQLFNQLLCRSSGRLPWTSSGMMPVSKLPNQEGGSSEALSKSTGAERALPPQKPCCRACQFRCQGGIGKSSSLPSSRKIRCGSGRRQDKKLREMSSELFQKDTSVPVFLPVWLLRLRPAGAFGQSIHAQVRSCRR